MPSAEYLKIDGLIKSIEKFQISITAADSGETIGQSFYQRLRVTIGGQQFTVPIMDEFSDIENGNCVVLLHFVLSECEMFEEADDIVEWAEDVGLKLADSCTHIIFRELNEAVPRLRTLIGHETKAISSYEIEFNTDVAKSLRAAAIS